MPDGAAPLMTIDFWPAFFGVLAALVAWRLRGAWLVVALVVGALGALGLAGWGIYELHTRYPDWWMYPIGAILVFAPLSWFSNGFRATWRAFSSGLRGKPETPPT